MESNFAILMIFGQIKKKMFQTRCVELGRGLVYKKTHLHDNVLWYLFTFLFSIL